MPVTERSIVINAPVEKVFAVIDDLRRVPEYMHGVVRTADIKQTPRRIGDTMRLTYSVMGLRFPMKATVLEREENKRGVIKMEGGMNGTITGTYEPQGSATKVTWRFDYTMKGGILGKAVNALLVERMNERNAEVSLENLKMICEAG